MVEVSTIKCVGGLSNYGVWSRLSTGLLGVIMFGCRIIVQFDRSTGIIGLIVLARFVCEVVLLEQIRYLIRSWLLNAESLCIRYCD